MNSSRTGITAILIATAMLSTAGAAMAGRYDGSWSMVAETTRGHCGVINVGFAISRGRIQSSSGSFALNPIRLEGRVSSSGRARLTAVTGPRIARGTGRFNGLRGRGIWSGTGPSGLCSGVWNANRS